MKNRILDLLALIALVAFVATAQATPVVTDFIESNGGAALPAAQASSSFQFSLYGTIEGVNTSPFMDFRRTNGSAALPSATVSGNTLLRISGKGYAGSKYSGAQVSFVGTATENYTDTAHGTKATIATTRNGDTSSVNRLEVTDFGALAIGLAATSTPAWLDTGVVFRVLPQTSVDTTSSGPVSDVAAVTFGVQTFNSVNSTTADDASVFLIKGDAATIGGFSALNKWGLRNKGKTRLDGRVLVGSEVEGTELASTPSAPPANGYKIYAKDNGAGKTTLYVLFSTGAEIALAVQQ